MDYVEFSDYYHNNVKLSFEDHPFSKSPKHVWVIAWFKNSWLLTEHPRRGIEFPGGKVEPGENAIQAAIREVDEETGGQVEQIHYLGQYKVDGKGGIIIKNIYFATIKNLQQKDVYFETNGPVLLKKLPENIKYNQNYSFMMKDKVLERSMDKVNEKYQSIIGYE
jgi:8-oxo-dGTP diphosphatase